MKISNPRITLLENIRQSCIYLTTLADTDIYWKYMMTFSDTCADINNLLFNEDCSTEVMRSVGIKVENLEKCMQTEIIST